MRGQAKSYLLVACLASVPLASCAEEEYPAWLWNLQHPSGQGDAPDASTGSFDAGPRYCTQAHAVSIPARLEAMSSPSVDAGSAADAGGGSEVFVADIFQRFVSICGPCHGPSVDPPGLGGFQIQTSADFSTLMTSATLHHVTTAVCPSSPEPGNPNDPMPPCSSPNGGTYAARPETDPVKQLAELVTAWLAAGSPPAFTPSTSFAASSSTDAGADAGLVATYVMTPDVGNAMTNIGNCVPTPGLTAIQPGSDADTKTRALDAMFAGLTSQPGGTPAQAIGLPEDLRDTDLFTFETSALAQTGVIAYAPAYPLWSDNAEKVRYVRVPRGQSIQFDKATQRFTIPNNTRFYKTFLKQVVDTDGSIRYRKIETRLIVSRSTAGGSDASAAPPPVYGTYQWNADESDAVLVETPLNSGLPFADTILFYDTDEPLAADILLGQPSDPEAALVAAGAARHYALPSSQRCGQCHGGSESESFILGFMPLQVNMRPVGQGGVIEANGPDELNQLERLVSYGVISGVDALSDVLPLEQAEGTRAPRNDYELTAQGYALGNCSHCHNPNGLATQQNPVLQGVLDFLPSAQGGLFQFPLERYSPRIGRGLTGTTPIPYITPSLMDLPRLNPATGGPAGDPFSNANANGDAAEYVVYAPWRSLIYRNVDTAFAYTDDSALFPHMPMNTAGYDPRVKQIMSDWMVSIPAARKHPEYPEYAFEGGSAITCDTGVLPTTAPVVIGGATVDPTPQPYEEITPETPGYAEAVAAAQERLAVLHSGANPAMPLDPAGGTFSRYDDPGDTDDILDPAVLQDPLCHPIPTGCVQLPTTTFISQGVPYVEHPNWVVTDLTLPPGPWSPRRPDWATVLVPPAGDAFPPPPPEGGTCGAPAGAEQAYEDQLAAISLLQTATLEQVATYATTPVPFGLWQQQPGCNFSSVPTVQSFANSPPNWVTVSTPPPGAPVYVEPPGAAVFKEICINCHGPIADGTGRMAQNLATMTGGLAVPADLHDGLFGPQGASGNATNIHLVFGSQMLPAGADANWTGSAQSPVSETDRAARYMPWMALGGTQVQIPLAILEIISATQVLDQQRIVEASSLSANMLSQAKALCYSILGPGYRDGLLGAYFDPTPGRGYLAAGSTHLNDQLIFANGDAELWLGMCNQANGPGANLGYPPVSSTAHCGGTGAPVHVLQLNTAGPGLHVTPLQDDQLNYSIDAVAPGTLICNQSYPAGTPIGNERAQVVSALASDNLWPWCVATTVEQAGSLPVCPASVQALSRQCESDGNMECFADGDAEPWTVRGAINAGMSVFAYLQSIETSGPPPDYNQCQLLH